MTFNYPHRKILHSICLFHLATKGATYGYALATELEQIMGWKPSQTAVYNILRALEAEDAVTSEERIESGRLQKVYTITSKGAAMNEENTRKLRTEIMKIFSMFIGLMQNVTDTDSEKELQSMLIDFRHFSRLVFKMGIIVPKETHVIVSTALSAMIKLASEKKISFPDFDAECSKDQE